jgi:plastocyanin
MGRFRYATTAGIDSGTESAEERECSRQEGYEPRGRRSMARRRKYVVRKAGEYAYTCTLHPNMKGTLKVE